MMRRRLSMIHAALAGVLILGVAACSEEDTPAGGDAGVGQDTGQDMAADMADMKGPPDLGPPDMGPPDLGPPDMGRPLPEGEPVEAVSFFLFPPVPLQCDDPRGRYRVPFALPTDKVRPARLGDYVGGRQLEPNNTLDLSKISAHRVRINQFGTIPCTSDADCDRGQGFRCLAAGDWESQRYCSVPTGAVFLANTVEMDVEPGNRPESNQLVTLLFEATKSYSGQLPRSAGELYGPDPADPQSATLVKDLFGINERATDPAYEFQQALSDFYRQVASVASPRNTRVSLWKYAGNNRIQVLPLTRAEPENIAEPDHYITDLSKPADTLDGLLPKDFLNRPANLYQGILEVIDRDMALDKYTDYEKFLFVFTDGYNEVYDEDATRQKVLEALQANNIRLYIVHFDPEIDASLLRDIPEYVTDRPPCDGDEACESWQSCRRAKLYPADEAGSITETSLPICMPDYVDGRLGPIESFADLACRTGGNYFYARETDELSSIWKRVAYVIDGQWSVEADFSALSTAKGLSDGFYNLSGIFVGGFGNIGRTDKLAAPAPGNEASFDTRQLIRVGDP